MRNEPAQPFMEKAIMFHPALVSVATTATTRGSRPGMTARLFAAV